MSWNISVHYTGQLAKFILVIISSSEYFIVDTEKILDTE